MSDKMDVVIMFLHLNLIMLVLTWQIRSIITEKLLVSVSKHINIEDILMKSILGS